MAARRDAPTMLYVAAGCVGDTRGPGDRDLSTTRPHIYGSLDRPVPFGLRERGPRLATRVFSEFHISPRRSLGWWRPGDIEFRWPRSLTGPRVTRAGTREAALPPSR